MVNGEWQKTERFINLISYKLYMKNKIKQREIVRIQYFIYCPECNKEISGFSPGQVEYALSSHIKQKHQAPFKKKTKIGEVRG